MVCPPKYDDLLEVVVYIYIYIYIYISCGGIGHVEDMTTVQKLGLSSSWPRVENPWFSAWQHWLGAHF